MRDLDGVQIPESASPVSGEQRLWQAILLQAFIDIRAGNMSNYGRENDRKIATAWFKRADKDFVATCMFAGVCPKQARAAALEKIV